MAPPPRRSRSTGATPGDTWGTCPRPRSSSPRGSGQRTGGTPPARSRGRTPRGNRCSWLGGLWELRLLGAFWPLPWGDLPLAADFPFAADLPLARPGGRAAGPATAPAAPARGRAISPGPVRPIKRFESTDISRKVPRLHPDATPTASPRDDPEATGPNPFAELRTTAPPAPAEGVIWWYVVGAAALVAIAVLWFALGR